ncbi:MAG TPA: hypothetical protein VEK57_26890 [Thermoanaerobaculia bacterium]|nr:hypothetical protein [Thermoanaerobaculia bacterium]
MNAMLRASGFLVLLLLSSPLFAKWEVRTGLRAGYAVVTVDREETGRAYGGAVGGEGLWARGPFGVSAGLDYYDAEDAGDVLTVSFDALARWRMRGDRTAWIALGRSTVDVGNDVGSTSVWAPSAGYSWPLGKRQLLVTVRHHNAARHIDPRFRAEELNTTMLMVGIRSSNLLEW